MLALALTLSAHKVRKRLSNSLDKLAGLMNSIAPTRVSIAAFSCQQVSLLDN